MDPWSLLSLQTQRYLQRSVLVDQKRLSPLRWVFAASRPLIRSQWLMYNRAGNEAEHRRLYSTMGAAIQKAPDGSTEMKRRVGGKDRMTRQRSRSRMDGNKPGDQEQGAGAHCRRRKNIAGGSWSINVLADGQGETSRVEAFSQRRSAGRRGGLAGWIGFTSQRARRLVASPEPVAQGLTSNSTQMWAPYAVQADVIAMRGRRGSGGESAVTNLERELRMS